MRLVVTYIADQGDYHAEVVVPAAHESVETFLAEFTDKMDEVLKMVAASLPSYNNIIDKDVVIGGQAFVPADFIAIPFARDMQPTLVPPSVQTVDEWFKDVE